MAFTDKDLQRVKDELAANRRMEWPMPDCEALLSRLSAAERCLSLYQTKKECGDILGDTDDLFDADEAWRIASGKEPKA